MQQPPPRKDHSRKSLLRYLDRMAGEINRVAGAINPYLMGLAVGLFILNLVCLVALEGSSLPIMKISPDPVISPSPRAGNVDTVAQPSAAAAARSGR